jgi:hypothetical protein
MRRKSILGANKRQLEAEGVTVRDSAFKYVRRLFVRNAASKQLQLGTS